MVHYTGVAITPIHLHGAYQWDGTYVRDEIVRTRPHSRRRVISYIVDFDRGGYPKKTLHRATSRNTLLNSKPPKREQSIIPCIATFDMKNQAVL